MAQLVSADGRSLLIGRPANIRRWAATHLGARARKGARPPTNLSWVAAAVRYVGAVTPFQQRLRYERLMAAQVPASTRRELKPPAFLHLDPGQRFPRLSVRASASGRGRLFGPFPRRKDAEEARLALDRRFRLRPCEYVFEPDPQLALGLGCLYAQTRSCAAPCLARVTEEGYRALAAEAAAFLAGPDRRPGLLPGWVGQVDDNRALVAEPHGDGVAIYPVRRWCVVEEHALLARPGAIEEAVSALCWPDAPAARDDLPWLVAWLRSPGTGAYLDAATSPTALAAGLRDIIGHL